MMQENEEFNIQWCKNCINRYAPKPNPCMSCEQKAPTNFEEE
jgi:hypothetical protein